jgi:hypothetical protein
MLFAWLIHSQSPPFLSHIQETSRCHASVSTSAVTSAFRKRAKVRREPTRSQDEERLSAQTMTIVERVLSMKKTQ